MERALAVVRPVAMVALLAAACGRTPVSPPPSSAAPVSAKAAHLLLITIDTLRADHVGAYGYAAARTPTLDAIAGRGVRFERAFAVAPITLTSHASLLTGRYPPGHGARHNGVRMNAVPTLATILRAQGFATAAFVAAFPLDHRFGLAEGFDRYSDHLPRGRDGRPLDERPAREVADEAIAWLREHGAGRSFAWIHFFEPHAPYGPPEDAGRPAIERYDGEIAAADREAGRVIAALGPALDSTLIVVAGDHGEAFGEHGEVSHSLFVYDTTLRVPLLMAGPGLAGGLPLVVRQDVSLVDVMPTLLSALGVPPADADGIDLHRFFDRRGPPSDRVLYAESFAPLLDFGWSSLRTVRTGRWKYVAAPKPELYDLEADPAEQHSETASHPEIAAALDARVRGFGPAELTADAGRHGATEPEVARRLQALGYVGAARVSGTRERPDPKDRKSLARDLALVLSGEVRGDALRQTLSAILREDPGNVQAHLRLGFLLLEDQQAAAAQPHFAAATRTAPRNADAWLGVASCAGARGDLRTAEAALARAAAAEPGNPVVDANRGVLLSKTGRHAEAVALLARVVATDPQFDEARFNLALAYARAGERARALAETLELLRRLPPDAAQRPELERLRGHLEHD